MVDMFKSVRGKRTNGYVATMPAVQAELDKKVKLRARRAARLLAQHKNEDHAYIDIEKNGAGRYIVLNDASFQFHGNAGAMSIEFGRKPSDRDKGHEGLFILHRAVMDKEGRR